MTLPCKYSLYNDPGVYITYILYVQIEIYFIVFYFILISLFKFVLYQRVKVTRVKFLVCAHTWPIKLILILIL